MNSYTIGRVNHRKEESDKHSNSCRDRLGRNEEADERSPSQKQGGDKEAVDEVGEASGT